MNLNGKDPKSTLEKPLILLVDDVPQNVQILHQILKDGDYSFAIATSGEEALRSVKMKAPDLILLDIMLGDIDGFDVCKQIKENPDTAEIPVIFLTAKIGVEDKVEGFRLGAVDYITKPFEDSEVVARVNTHIRLKRSIDLMKDYNRQLTETLEEMNKSFDDLQHSQEAKIAREKEDAVKAVSVSATHEINQPVTVIQGYLDLLKQSLDPETHTSDQMKYINRMETGLNRLISILEKFRRFSYLYFQDYEKQKSSNAETEKNVTP
ncbi:MAG: response regulator [Candidatus Omnitrophota bacterium]